MTYKKKSSSALSLRSFSRPLLSSPFCNLLSSHLICAGLSLSIIILSAKNACGHSQCCRVESMVSFPQTALFPNQFYNSTKPADLTTIARYPSAATMKRK